MAKRSTASHTAAAALDGRPVIFIELRRGDTHQWAIVDAADWPRIQEISPIWGLPGRGHPRAFIRRHDGSRGVASLARVVSGASHRERVHHLNGNPLDCRSDNLEKRVSGHSPVTPRKARRAGEGNQGPTETDNFASQTTSIREMLMEEVAQGHGRRGDFYDDL